MTTPIEAWNAAKDLSDSLNRFADVALSGTPRVCICQSRYFKVYPVCEESGTAPFDPTMWKTYDDAALSGPPTLMVFAHDEDLYWVKGYPAAAETLNPSADIIQNLAVDFPDDAVAGTLEVFRILSGGNYYYFKAYKRPGFDNPLPAPGVTPPSYFTLPAAVVTPLTEARDAVRTLLSNPGAMLYRDAEIDSWLNQAAIDVSGKSLCCRENKTVYAPLNDLSDSLNRLLDVTLSGTPRVSTSRSHYFKVFPAREGSETPSSDPETWLTYDDADLSGTPKRLGFAYDGDLYWVKGYPAAAATSNPTDDSIQDLAFAVPDDAVAGALAVFQILSGGNYYYFKAYKLYGYAVCDALLTLPMPTGTLKLLSVYRTDDGGYPQGMMRIHPRMMGRLSDATSGDSRFFFEFAQELGLTPGGGSLGVTLNLHRAYLVDAFVDLPDDMQPSAILYAYVMALYKALKFESAAMSYRTYLQTIFQIRREIYEMDADDKADFILPDRKELVRQ